MCPPVMRLVAAILLAGLLGTGCAINPVTGFPIATLLSTKQEAELGEKAAQQLAQSIGLVPDADLTDYVQVIGNRLAKESPRTDVAYTFHVVEMAEPTAFALPGGYIYVSRGALLMLNSEAELAGVLGHEIAGEIVEVGLGDNRHFVTQGYWVPGDAMKPFREFWRIAKF